MASRWLAFLVWGCIGFSAVAWLLQMTVVARPVPTDAVVVDTAQTPRGDWTRLFGAPVVVEEVAVATPLQGRFKLVGVVASRHETDAAQGLAVISVDGKPARAYRVGSLVEGDTVLQAVRARAADLGPSGAAPVVKLELAPLAPPATGTLPGLGGPTLPPPLPPAPVPGSAEAAQTPEPPPGVPPAMTPQPPNAVPQLPQVQQPRN